MALSALPWLTAFVGGLVGSSVSWLIARRQIYATIVSSSRQNWINTLRDTISEFQSSCSGIVIFYPLEKGERNLSVLLERVSLLKHKIALLLNPNETLHRELLKAVHELNGITIQSAGTNQAMQLRKLSELIPDVVGQQLIDLHPRFCYTSDVAATVDLQQMSVADKLRLMEALWRDLSAKDTEVVSPEWHRDVLEERDRKIASGEESFIDWEVAKKKLREEVQ